MSLFCSAEIAEQNQTQIHAIYNIKNPVQKYKTVSATSFVIRLNQLTFSYNNYINPKLTQTNP